MLRYCTNRHRLWCPAERTIFLGKGIIFDELKFSFDDEYIDSTPDPEEDKDNESTEIQTSGGVVNNL